MGIEHVILPEKGLVKAGDVVIGADSHTCTYGALGAFATGVGSTDMAAGMATGRAWLKVPEAIKFVLKGKPKKWVSGKDIILHLIGEIGVDGALYKSMEFVGGGIKHLTMDDRFTMANMAIEAGAKNGIFICDDTTKKYIASRKSKGRKSEPIYYEPDTDAPYERVLIVDLGSIRPTVAFPHLPENTKTIDEVGNILIDQVVIGSCTNGRLEDMRIAASILRTGKVHRRVRCIIFPGSQEVYLESVRNGFVETFIKAGAIISTPTCGPCIGGHMGILAEGEKAVSTTNRNFVGRMGHITSEIYLASPAVAAASALFGKITNPETIKIKEEK
jgi:3-isopropylmalate/(R)-2-methylmalate dehydratase large subunit